LRIANHRYFTVDNHDRRLDECLSREGEKALDDILEGKNSLRYSEFSGHNIYHTADGSNYIRLGPKGTCPPGMYPDQTLGVYHCHDAHGTHGFLSCNSRMREGSRIAVFS
jgi:hypothetical protein